MAYRVAFRPSAARALEKRERPVRERLRRAIDALTEAPRPFGSQKLAGREARYRVRVGDFRVVYEIQDAALLVLVVRVGHRGDVYRDR